MAVLKYYNTATSAWEYIAASTTANFTSWKKTMAGGETSVSGTDDNAVTLSYTVGLEQVFINPQYPLNQIVIERIKNDLMKNINLLCKVIEGGNYRQILLIELIIL